MKKKYRKSPGLRDLGTGARDDFAKPHDTDAKRASGLTTNAAVAVDFLLCDSPGDVVAAAAAGGAVEDAAACAWQQLDEAEAKSAIVTARRAAAAAPPGRPYRVRAAFLVAITSSVAVAVFFTTGDSPIVKNILYPRG